MKRSALLNGAIVVAINIAALSFCFAVSSLTPSPFLVFIPTVWVSAWYGGVPGMIFSIIVAILGLHYFVIPPPYSFEFGDWANETLFVLVAGIVSLIAFDRRRSFAMRRRMETIVNSSEDAIVGITPDGMVLTWNPAAEKIYEYSAQEAIGRPILSVLSSNLCSAIGSILQQMNQGSSSGSFEAVQPQKNGGLIDLSVHVSPIRKEDGRITAVTIIGRDVSSQKRTQDWLETLSDAVENTTELVFITNRQGVIEYVNPAFQIITGYSAQEALGQTPRLLKSERHLPAFYEKLWSTITSGQVFRDEIVNRRKDGELYYLLETIAPVRDRRGEIVRFVTTGKDITERVLSGQVLQEQVKERTRELSTLYDITTISSDAMDLSVLLERALNRILSATSADNSAIYLLDETKDALNLSFTRGNGFRKIIKLCDPNAALSPIRRVALDKKPYIAIDTLDNLFDVTAFTDEQAQAEGYAVAVVPICVEARLIGVLGTIREKTRPFLSLELALLTSICAHLGISIERIRLTADMQKRAALAERERLAHELHDSVTQNIYGTTLLAEAARRFMATGDTRTASHYLAQLSQLSQQSQKEMRLLVYQLRPLALTENSLIEALQQRLDAVERRAGVDARFECCDSIKLPAAVEDAFYRVAQEALNNSLAHSAASTVTVRLDVNENRVELLVKDDGKGFDHDDAARHGAGVGLESMRKRIERLGGKLEIRSKPGEGTRVTADLLLVRDREESNE